MFNFYHRFVPRMADLLRPLYAAIATNSTDRLEWNIELDDAFQQARQALANATMLEYPDPHARLALTTDASDTAVGAVVEQFRHGQWRPLSFFSRQLKSSERHDSAYDKELLAIYLAVLRFRHLLEGKQFTIFTDHSPLVTSFPKATTPVSPHQ